MFTFMFILLSKQTRYEKGEVLLIAGIEFALGFGYGVALFG